MNLPGTLNSPPNNHFVTSSAQNFAQPEAANAALGYSTMSGLPAGLSGPNVIVVDTSSLKTREEERKEAEAKKKKNKKKNKKEEVRKKFSGRFFFYILSSTSYEIEISFDNLNLKSVSSLDW